MSSPNLSHQERVRMPWGKLKLRPSDILFSQYVRIKDGKCQRCSSPVKLNDKGLPVSHQASHFQGRRKENTRFSLSNVCCLCPNCHRYLGENPAEHYEFQVKRLGQKEVDAVILASNQYKKRDDAMDKLLWSQALKDIIK